MIDNTSKNQRTIIDQSHQKRHVEPSPDTERSGKEGEDTSSKRSSFSAQRSAIATAFEES